MVGAEGYLKAFVIVNVCLFSHIIMPLFLFYFQSFDL